jgi:hypothetical protein
MEEPVMTDKVQGAVHTGHGPQSPAFPDSSAEITRAGSRMDLPHAFYVVEAHLRPAESIVHRLAYRHTKPEEFQSSACFDAWAKDDEAN